MKLEQVIALSKSKARLKRLVKAFSKCTNKVPISLENEWRKIIFSV